MRTPLNPVPPFGWPDPHPCSLRAWLLAPKNPYSPFPASAPQLQNGTLSVETGTAPEGSCGQPQLSPSTSSWPLASALLWAWSRAEEPSEAERLGNDRSTVPTD